MARGLDADTISLDALIESSAAIPVEILMPVRESLAFAMQGVFIATFIAALLAWLVAMLAPPMHLGTSAPASVKVESLPAE